MLQLVHIFLIAALLVIGQRIKPLAPTAMPPLAPDLKHNAKNDNDRYREMRLQIRPKISLQLAVQAGQEEFNKAESVFGQYEQK